MIDWNTIILAVIGLIGTIATSIIAIYTRQIHTAVNSERTAMVDEVRELRAEIKALSVDKATLQEQARPPH